MAKQSIDRRLHKRLDLACLTAVRAGQAQTLADGRTINISDGGMLLAVPAKALPARGSRVELVFSVPRSTPNTYMLEEFRSPARVVRHQPLKERGLTGLALQFAKPLDMVLEA